MKLPKKGKTIIALCTNGESRYLFRCNCADKKCTEWRDDITGGAVLTKVNSWKYLNKE